MAQAAPYKIGAANFKMGNPALAKKVLDLWKDWDDNTFDKHNYFADTITMYLPDGMVVKGKAENIAGAKKYRGDMKSAVSVVHACVSLFNKDDNNEAVCIWGTETDTWPDGKVETRDLHEVWWFNKDGKVSGMRQWASKFGK